jgi:2-amino-4-hydroxy-6-hydroxymethyldihydropteridine diphosphokinase
VSEPQARYLNAALVGGTRQSAAELLADLQAIETAMGRTRPYPNAPRILDLDLILFGALSLETAALTVPHPRFRERRFVLEPLVEIAPELRDPVTGLTVADLLSRIG